MTQGFLHQGARSEAKLLQLQAEREAELRTQLLEANEGLAHSVALRKDPSGEAIPSAPCGSPAVLQTPQTTPTGLGRVASLLWIGRLAMYRQLTRSSFQPCSNLSSKSHAVEHLTMCSGQLSEHDSENGRGGRVLLGRPARRVSFKWSLAEGVWVGRLWVRGGWRGGRGWSWVGVEGGGRLVSFLSRDSDSERYPPHTLCQAPTPTRMAIEG